MAHLLKPDLTMSHAYTCCVHCLQKQVRIVRQHQEV